jgi:3-oxoadipate enol-lactonase
MRKRYRTLRDLSVFAQAPLWTYSKVNMAEQQIDKPTIAYGDRGSGTPLVLLHGFPLDRRMWEAQLRELSSQCRIITPDLPGFGKSTSEEPFTIESLADDLRAWLLDLHLLPCVLGGLSMGGYVALAFAKKHADDLRGLLLIDTRAEADTPEAREGRAKMIQLVRTSGSSAVADQMIERLLSPGTLEHRPAIGKKLRKMIEQCPARTIEHALIAMRDRPDRTAQLASIAVPTLILVGDADVITPPSVAEAMHQRIAGSTMRIVSGAGHMSPMEQPSQVNQAIEQYLQTLGV